MSKLVFLYKVSPFTNNQGFFFFFHFHSVLILYQTNTLQSPGGPHPLLPCSNPWMQQVTGKAQKKPGLDSPQEAHGLMAAIPRDQLTRRLAGALDSGEIRNATAIPT